MGDVAAAGACWRAAWRVIALAAVVAADVDTTCPPRVPGATKICLRGA